MGHSGLGRDHNLVHPTMCVSFLAAKGGSSISEVEAAGITSSGGRKPLLSIRLDNRTEDYVMMHLGMNCTCSVNNDIIKKMFMEQFHTELTKMFLNLSLLSEARGELLRN